MKNILLILLSLVIISSCSNKGGSENLKEENSSDLNLDFLMQLPEQEICKDLKGKKRLFGLCNAYCSALGGEELELKLLENGMLIEEINLKDVKGSKLRGALAVLNQYNKYKKNSDPEMPCRVKQEESQCPVFTQEEIDGMIPGYFIDPLYTGNIWLLQEVIALVDDDPDFGYMRHAYYQEQRGELVDGQYIMYRFNNAYVQQRKLDDGTWGPYYAVFSDRGSEAPSEFLRFAELTKGEAKACREILFETQNRYPLDTSSLWVYLIVDGIDRTDDLLCKDCGGNLFNIPLSECPQYLSTPYLSTCPDSLDN